MGGKCSTTAPSLLPCEQRCTNRLTDLPATSETRTCDASDYTRGVRFLLDYRYIGSVTDATFRLILVHILTLGYSFYEIVNLLINLIL